MFGILKMIMMSLTMSGSPTADMNTNSDNPYVGTWEWEQTITKGRGGENIANPSTTNVIKHIIITEDNKVQIFENGIVSCESDFTANEVKNQKGGRASNTPKNNAECMNGTLSIVDGKLQQYVYLGCPSATSYFKKVK